MAHTDNGYLLDRTVRVFVLLALPRLVVKACYQLAQVGARGNAVDGHDLDHAPIFLTIKHGTELQLLHFQRLDQQLLGLDGVAEDVVVVDVVHLESGVLLDLVNQGWLSHFLHFHKKTLGRRLNFSDIYVGPNKSTTIPHRTEGSRG